MHFPWARQHRDEDIRIRRHIGRVGPPAGSATAHRVFQVSTQVPGRDAVPGANEVRAHGQAHPANADKADAQHLSTITAARHHFGRTGTRSASTFTITWPATPREPRPDAGGYQCHRSARGNARARPGRITRSPSHCRSRPTAAGSSPRASTEAPWAIGCPASACPFQPGRGGRGSNANAPETRPFIHRTRTLLGRRSYRPGAPPLRLTQGHRGEPDQPSGQQRR